MNSAVPVFFSSDKNYLPYLSVAIKSLIAHTTQDNDYHIYVLTPDITQVELMRDFDMVPQNVSIMSINIRDKLDSLNSGKKLRDYYTLSIYSRLFIPEMFTQYDKVIYLDCDVIVNTDIAKMYHTDIGNNYLGCVLDKAVMHCPDFVDYVIHHIGCDNDRSYFNSGVLLMNNRRCRLENMLDAFYEWLGANNSTVAPDQDFLNVFCKNQVTYLPAGWDEMPIADELSPDQLYIIHFNMFQKPWKYKGLMYEDYFWNHAKNSIYYVMLLKQRDSYTDQQKANDIECMQKLIQNAANIAQKYKQAA